jgi:hypothetical protein
MTRIRAMAVLAFVSVSGLAEANHTLATATQAQLGEVRSQTLAFNDVAYFGYILRPNRSYVAMCWLPDLEDGVAFSTYCRVEFRDFADATVGTDRTGVEGFPKSGEAAAITPTFFQRYYARVLNNSGSQQTIKAIVIETTLASPWYFVSSEYEGFVEIRNQTDQSVSVTVRAYDSSGTIAGQTTLALSANGTAVVQVGATLGVSGFGSATITHDAMPGGVVANITTLSAMTGLSFDAPFTPRMVWSLF